MPTLEPLYSHEHCSFCAPLRWGLTLFWRAPVKDATWFEELVQDLDADGIRLLSQRFPRSGLSQLSLSTLPHVTPMLVVNRVKGRLQHLIRASHPKAFRRNYALRSFGSATRSAVEAYIASQLEHHRLADDRVQALLEKFQIYDPTVDLSQPRQTSHGIFWYNLHIVLVHRERWAEVDEERLNRVKTMIGRVCRVKGYALSRAGILLDHIHLALGCPFETAPTDVALAFLNNLAYVYGMKPVFQYGAYVGTFGEYHRGAVVNDKERSIEETNAHDGA